MAGDVLARLKDGRSVRVDLEVSVLPAPAATPAASTRQAFVLSYDLWEEKFAVVRAGTPARSASNLTSADAEAWCLEQLAVPLAALARLGRGEPFWVRLEYRVVQADIEGEDATDRGYTLRGLIEALSRRSTADAAARSVQAGPFRLPQ